VTSRLADTLSRRVVPRAVVALSRVDAPARLGARARRAAGRRARVELFFAFDDPCSAVAVLDLAWRLADYDVQLVPRPVVRRGIPGDPAVEDKRRYALQDARRLARRHGCVLSRDAPVAPDDVAFLAAWGAAAPDLEFCVAALTRLWLTPGAPAAIDRAAYAALWRGGTPPVEEDDAGVRRNERLMARRGPYDTPAAVLGGQWSFAHDRPAQIAARLDDLGWRTPA
jgi:2-hydroxychromene-2-carboxylate isomerase